MFLFVFCWGFYSAIKCCTHEIPTRKNLSLRNYPQEKIWDPPNTHESKFWIHQIPKRKKIQTHEIPTMKSLKISTRKRLRPTKYQEEKISDRQRDDVTMIQDPQWHEIHGI